MTEAVNTMDTLQADLNDIYLGNLGTIDCDMKLPATGKRGSSFTWESQEILFISHTGKVTRPTCGVGNREVVLIVTGIYEDSTQQKAFTATVLEEVPDTQILRTEVLTIPLGEAKKRLPSVCIALLDTGHYTTKEVQWLDDLDDTRLQQTITGHTKEEAFPVTLQIGEQSLEIMTQLQLHSYGTTLLEGSILFNAADRMLTHLRQVSIDQLLYSFRETAGLSTQGAEPMSGWDAPECSLRGHTTGHYLSALSLAAYSTDEAVFRKQVQTLVLGLEECQQALTEQGMNPGFLSAYSEEQFDLLETFTTYPTIWAPYYTLDKLLQGLLDSYEYGNCLEGLTVARKLGDWTYQRLKKLTPNQLNQMWAIYIAGEFGGMISSLMRLYHVTADDSYLKTALLFENDKLFVPMRENYDTLDGVHANQHIPQIIGALDIYEETGDEKFYVIAENFWQMIVGHHAYSIGGVGETEMFKASDKIAAYLTTKSAESCASHNLLKLTRKLFDLNPDAAYFDYYENTLHNHLLSACSHHCDGGTTYFMPLSPGAQKRFDTHENTCCHGTGLETMLRFSKDIYAFSDTTAYVNLFYPSQVDWLAKESRITQQHQQHAFIFTFEGTTAFALQIRVPKWATIETVCIDNQVTEPVVADGYLQVQKTPEMTQLLITYTPKLRVLAANDDSSCVSIAYGRDILALLSEETAMQTLTLEEINDYSQTDDVIIINQQAFVPLNSISDEHYHVYFRLTNEYE